MMLFGLLVLKTFICYFSLYSSSESVFPLQNIFKCVHMLKEDEKQTILCNRKLSAYACLVINSKSLRLILQPSWGHHLYIFHWFGVQNNTKSAYRYSLLAHGS